MRSTLLGAEKRPGSLKDKLIDLLDNSNHLWMWDKDLLKQALSKIGFSSVRECFYGDSTDKKF